MRNELDGQYILQNIVNLWCGPTYRLWFRNPQNGLKFYLFHRQNDLGLHEVATSLHGDPPWETVNGRSNGLVMDYEAAKNWIRDLEPLPDPGSTLVDLETKQLLGPVSVRRATLS